MRSQQDTALLPVEQIDKDLADLIMMMDQLPYDRARDWLVTKLAAHRLQAKPSASCEAGEVERVARAIDPIEWKTIDHWWPYRGTANYDDRIDDMRARSMDRARAAIAALRANAPEGEDKP